MNTKHILGLLALSLVATGFHANEAMALSEFKKAFGEKYIKTSKNAEFVTVAKKASCNVCHVKAKGAKKDVQNEYGKALNKLIEGSAKERKAAAKKVSKEDETNEKTKLLAELDAAFKKVEAMKSDGGKGPTFGALLKDGKLPVQLDLAAKRYEAAKAKATETVTEAP